MKPRCFFTVAILALANALYAAGLGDPGRLKSLSINTGRSQNGTFTIAGRDSGQQLLVTGHYASGQVRDLTRQVKYNVAPSGVVEISSTGYVTSVGEGQSTIHVTFNSSLDTTTEVVVTDIVHDLSINFANEVVPIFTKFGCNSGGCHGKSGGQNGFQLSLLGFEPTEDYEHLVKESRGRRVSPAAPASSLLLRKASGFTPHGGGSRIIEDSPSYRIIRRWMEQGMRYGRDDDPVVQRIEVFPPERLLGSYAAGGSQQLVIVAHYSDGSTRDVTRMTQFESNATDIAEVSDTGLVKVVGSTGLAAVMARYQATVGVFRAIIPLGETVENLPKPNNFIDELVYKQWEKFGLPPSKVCNDSTFIRRVTIDIAGRLPTVEETEEFLSSGDVRKREKLVDRLVKSEGYADYFANKWSAVLRNKRASPGDDIKPTQAFHAWIRDSLNTNKPYDQFVREVLTATGEVVKVPPAAWYREVHDASAQMEDTAQLFLGLRIQCARCHHHPFEKWSQQDYYGFQAFFAQVDYKKPPPPPKGKKKKKGKPAPPPPLEVLFNEGVATATNPKTNEGVKPTGLGGQPLEIPANVDPRTKLADWLAEKDNPFFARSLVNRYWKHFFGRGLVDPEDDMRMTNPATNPELLDALAAHFVSSKFDMQDLVRTICTSHVYQLSAEANEHNGDDRQNFSRYYPKRLNAEVLLDAIDQLTQSPTRFQGMPGGTRAVQLPDNAFDSYFLTVFGRPNASSACECERSTDASLAQLLHLINSNEILSKAGGPRATNLAKDKRPHEERIRELYLVALARDPSGDEVSLLMSYIEKRGSDVKAAYEDIIWSLINAEEFLFNH